jgi:sulfur-carrier protein
MPVKLYIPLTLRKLADNASVVHITANSIRGMLAELRKTNPNLQERLLDDSGNFRRALNVYVNDEDIRFLQNQETPLKENDEVSIVPAIAGG